MSTTTTIQLTVEVKDALAKKGKKGDTFDDILRRMLGMANGKKAQQNGGSS